MGFDRVRDFRTRIFRRTFLLHRGVRHELSSKVSLRLIPCRGALMRCKGAESVSPQQTRKPKWAQAYERAGVL